MPCVSAGTLSRTQVVAARSTSHQNFTMRGLDCRQASTKGFSSSAVQCAHGLQRPHRASVAQSQLRDFALLPEVAVDTVLDHGDMEHLAGRSAVDISTLGEYLLPPLLPGNPGNGPRFDSRKVRHKEAASWFGNEGGAD